MTTHVMTHVINGTVCLEACSRDKNHDDKSLSGPYTSKLAKTYLLQLYDVIGFTVLSLNIATVDRASCNTGKYF